MQMASLRYHMLLLIVSFLLLKGTQVAFGNLQCEDLPIEDCAFAVSSSGARCVLEKYMGKDKVTRYECQTSIIMAEKRLEYIETNECMEACGLERMSFGLSTDSLLEDEFTSKLCSSSCQSKCDNIVDLYTSLVAGEGVYLPQLCAVQKLKGVHSHVQHDEKFAAQSPTSDKGIISGGEEGVAGTSSWAPTPAHAFV